MGKKGKGNKQKKKLTKKEQKALNHAKLMASKKSNVIEVDFNKNHDNNSHHEDFDKKKEAA